MMAGISQAIERAFGALLADDRVGLASEDGEIHIIGESWTLVVAGDPIASAMLAVDDEDGAPEAVLEAEIDDEELSALRDLDAALSGALSSALNESPDPLTQMLARVLEG